MLSTIALTLSVHTYYTEVMVNPIETSNPMDKFATGAKDLLGYGMDDVNIIVQTTTHDYTEITSLIESLGGTVTLEYGSINAIAVTIPAYKIMELALSSLVLKIFFALSSCLSG